jgi:hypothetical protein
MGSLPVSKREKIVYLLDHWVDIWDPDAASQRGSSGGGGVHLLGLMSRHPSVVELDRCLRVLKVERKLWHDHVKAFHCAEWGVRTRVSRRRRKGGKSEVVVLRDRVRRQPSWVKMGYVNSGVFRLEELFQGPVFVPGELWDALTLSSGEIEVRERSRRGRRAA